MNSTVLALNRWAGPALAVAWPMLWQSSLLIAFLFALDFAFRRRVRASVRYALWLVVLVKLVLPPSLALPTGLGWWLRPAAAAPARPHWAPVVVSHGPAEAELPLPPEGGAPAARPPARLSAGAWGLAGSGAVSLILLGWMLACWRQVASEARGAVPAPDRLEEMFVRARGLSGLRRRARVRLIARPMSPAVCGLFRPVILLPRVLAEQLPPHQLRAVLLHELVHLRRGDLWLSFAQALLQIVYWWHPLLWAANARIRRAREEAVDDAVMLALEDQAEAYAPTLVRVARLALARPPVSLGLVGTLESGSFLRQRVERLLDFHPPRKAGLTLASVFSVAAFAALALPMGQAPAPAPKPEPAAAEPASAPPATSSAPATGSDNALPVPNAYARTNHIFTGRGRQIIVSKLDKIRIDHFPVNKAPLVNIPLSEVVKMIDDLARRRDPTGQGINFIVAPFADPATTTAAGPTGTDPATGLPISAQGAETVDVNTIGITISLVLHDLRLADLLEIIVKAADKPIKCSIEDYAVVFSLKGQEPTPLYLRTIKVDPGALEKAVRGFLGLPGGGDRAENLGTVLRQFFAERGVDLSPPKSMFYGDRAGALLVYATLADLDIIERVVAALNTAPAQLPASGQLRSRSAVLAQEGKLIPPDLPFVHVSRSAVLVQDGALLYEMGKLDEAEAKLEEARKADPENQGAYYYLNLVSEARYQRDALPVPNPYARTNRIFTGRGRRIIVGKLDRIRFDEVKAMGNLPLSEVVKYIDELARKGDPEGHGINFIIDAGANPATGLHIAAHGAEAVDVNTVRIRLNQALHNVRLANLLEIIVKVADKPIECSIEDYAVVFSLKGQRPTPLYFRTIKLDPAAFEEGVRKFLGLPEGGNRAENLGTKLRQFFAECGVDISPPKSLFFNDREGTLLIHASLLDLDIIERVVQLLNPAPPQLPASEAHAPPRSAVLLQDGKLLFEMGKLDEAEARLKEAGRLDPRNQAVDYYLNLIREAREALKKRDSSGVIRTTNDPPYKVENHAVASSLKGQEATPLYFRTIKLDPATFEQGLRNSLGPPEGGGRAESLGAMFRRFFAGIGVDISPPKTLFYSHGEGTLLLYAPLADLDKIERAVQLLNTAPTQLSIQAVFIELPRAEVEGFWEKFGYTNGPAPGGSARTATLTHSSSATVLVSPRVPGGSARTATLTHAQAAAQLDRWKSMGGKNVLGEFRVTTLSGRQAQVSLGDRETMMTNVGQGRAKAELIPPALEITPRMTGDGPGVKLDLNATLCEFLGYAEPDPSAPLISIAGQVSQSQEELKQQQERLQNLVNGTNAAPGVPGLPLPHFRVGQVTTSTGLVTAVLPLPHFRIRPVAASVNVYDGQTVVLGGLETGETDQLILVTPTIVDPAGKRIYPQNK